MSRDHVDLTLERHGWKPGKGGAHTHERSGARLRVSEEGHATLTFWLPRTLDSWAPLIAALDRALDRKAPTP